MPEVFVGSQSYARLSPEARAAVDAATLRTTGAGRYVPPDVYAAAFPQRASSRPPSPGVPGGEAAPDPRVAAARERCRACPLSVALYGVPGQEGAVLCGWTYYPPVGCATKHVRSFANRDCPIGHWDNTAAARKGSPASQDAR
jgi:hypothetical protein